MSLESEPVCGCLCHRARVEISPKFALVDNDWTFSATAEAVVGALLALAIVVSIFA